MGITQIFFPAFYPALNRFSFKPSLKWKTQSEVRRERPKSIFTPIDFDYITHFRPECIGEKIPGLIGGTTFLHNGDCDYNIEKNSYHVRCLAEFIGVNLFTIPPLSNDVTNYRLEIGFALAETVEILIFTAPVTFKIFSLKAAVVWKIKCTISMFIQSYKDPRIVKGICLFVVYNSPKEKSTKYWGLKELEVEKILQTFGVTHPVFRGYRLGRDGKLIIPPKPSKDYNLQVPKGRQPRTLRPYKTPRWCRRKYRQFLRTKLQEYKKIIQIRLFRKEKYHDSLTYKVSKTLKETRRRRRRNRKLSKQLRDHRKVQDKKRRVVWHNDRENKLEDIKSKEPSKSRQLVVKMSAMVIFLFISTTFINTILNYFLIVC